MLFNKINEHTSSRLFIAGLFFFSIWNLSPPTHMIFGVDFSASLDQCQRGLSSSIASTQVERSHLILLEKKCKFKWEESEWPRVSLKKKLKKTAHPSIINSVFAEKGDLTHSYENMKWFCSFFSSLFQTEMDKASHCNPIPKLKWILPGNKLRHSVRVVLFRILKFLLRSRCRHINNILKLEVVGLLGDIYLNEISNRVHSAICHQISSFPDLL